VRRAASAALAAALFTTLAAGVLTGCSAAAAPVDRGAVPIPLPVPATPVAAAAGHPALVAMGDPVAVGGLVVTAHGPDLPSPPPGAPASVPGTITVTAAGTGPADLSAAAFDLRNQLGAPVPFRTTAVGPAAVRLDATMATGQTVLTWAPRQTPLAQWDFQVELD